MKRNKYRDGGQWNRTGKEGKICEGQARCSLWLIYCPELSHTPGKFFFAGLPNILFSSPRLMILSFNASMCFLRPGKNLLMRRSRQSASEYSLSLEKPPTVNKKIWPPLYLVPKKIVSFIAFRIALTLDVKTVWFGRQVGVCVNKQHINAIFWCSRFQKLNFDFLLLKLLICSP